MDVSIIIPTFNEKGNVGTIVERIEAALATTSYSYEIWFVDDSEDDTPDFLSEIANADPKVRYVHRDTDRGLATAVVEGFRRASGNHLIVMDADLQHPPELLPIMIERLIEGIEVLIPSRFVRGGSDGGLNTFRKFVSWTARTIARISIRRLRDVSDCTGGYFGVRRSVIEGVELSPVGWKILMEILVKGHYSTVHELPYKFVSRQAGQSKMSVHEQWNYLRHIVKLVKGSPEDRRFYMFCLVGSMGVIVNLTSMAIFSHAFQFGTIAASTVASLIAMAHNFLWNDRVTWRGHANPILWRRVLQFPLFVLISAVGVAVTALFARLAVEIGWNELVGQLMGIVVATGWGFLANNKWTWKQEQKKVAKVTVTQEYL
ncbi:glycosyltransferase family 2 protein [Alicyclobacillus sp. SO9]|uniref:glycosyltransferase n=1 Tax=Alicyclobacillus sp. SO9 TaxID=2665646 RepID=UPI0018E740A7|nr:glycosyltransferase family 2 protein [Alicyclobacillus sp. SO9]QQE79051.1 glycosyltransferase family 2 protein [Alicyclobacillus sp. SO9]